MAAAAADERFEDAARLRDRLRAIDKTQERQQAVSHGGGDQDVFGLYREGAFIEVQVLFVRHGKLTGNQSLPTRRLRASRRRGRGRGADAVLPGRTLRPRRGNHCPSIWRTDDVRAEYLSERRGRTVQILWPQRGDATSVCWRWRGRTRAELSGASRQRASVRADQRGVAAAPAPAQRAEADRVLRHLQPAGRACGRVDGDLRRGAPDTASYRRFRIKTVKGQDDFALMFEVLDAALPPRRRNGRLSGPAGGGRRQGAARSRGPGAARSRGRGGRRGRAGQDRECRGPLARARSSAARSASSCRAESTRSFCGATRTLSSSCSGSATRRTASRLPTTELCGEGSPDLRARRHPGSRGRTQAQATSHLRQPEAGARGHGRSARRSAGNPAGACRGDSPGAAAAGAGEGGGAAVAASSPWCGGVPRQARIRARNTVRTTLTHPAHWNSDC